MTRGLKYSLILHILVVAFLSFDFLSISLNKMPPSEVPLIIDLTNIKITEKTNLPPKIEPKKTEPKPKIEPEKKVEPKVIPPTKAAPPPPPPPKVEPKVDPKTVKLEPEKKEPPTKEAPKKAEQKKEPEKKAPPPPAPKQPAPPPKKQAEPKENLALKSLLASVSKIEESIKDRPQEETKTDDANQGVIGGSGGFLNRDLTISDKDALAAMIRRCWNFDAGAKGIENMVIEIRAFLNQDGSVRNVEIIDISRYNNDSFFRSIAESARRAVFICSPFTMLPEKYPEKFDNWKTLFLRFNPMDGGVF